MPTKTHQGLHGRPKCECPLCDISACHTEKSQQPHTLISSGRVWCFTCFHQNEMIFVLTTDTTNSFPLLIQSKTFTIPFLKHISCNMKLMSNTAASYQMGAGRFRTLIRSCSIAHQFHVVSTDAAMSLYGIIFPAVWEHALSLSFMVSSMIQHYNTWHQLQYITLHYYHAIATCTASHIPYD